ncbi:hypothetical protein M409DRAFT_53547 [Zasmidium cellare ATCC 36951]|uniref:Uncharacterized protein n=1 Tax=Zasmidium cellare ATCC 36951 TaxID=1080233 RepID=A0A6A6CQ49_ZASCE|nr:uncharacterized protein M409DRAFT_53547 [Zasmidium cellare ATCC 36951]KAF2168260.1 hypothetical protein M409DRAFT_53547 [Zasmidium cellare ATCC 36951]
MDPTTLVTFLFRAPPEVRTVELIGSWDNFNQPYRMHHDRRRGHGFWSGCFKFDNIIFDGEHMQWTKPRNGGLKQGGTYWYYYRLNYDIDAFDDRQPHTTACPLLPGQNVNVIDVPIEIQEVPSRCRSAYGDIIGTLVDHEVQQTLDPGSKLAPVVPPPISKVHSRCRTEEPLDGRLQRDQQPLIVVEDAVSPISSSCSPRARPVSKQSKASKKNGDVSRASSVYSQRSALSAPVSALSPSEAEDAAVDHKDFAKDLFPYPSVLGAAPIGSLEVLGAALFKSSDKLPIPFQEPPPIPDEPIRQHRRKPSDISLGPDSVQNVQFYGSRPGTNLTQDPEQHRPRMYSLPNLEIRDYQDNNGPPSSPNSSIYSPRESEDVDENLTPGDYTASIDMTSPTFSAATISTGGENTPFRLSAQNSYAGSTHVPPDAEPDTHNLGAIADRLRSLDRTASETTLHLSTAHEHPLSSRRLSPGFVNYSLPTIASASEHSLAKTASNPSAPRSSAREGGEFGVSSSTTMPAVFSAGEGEGRSMAEDIFSELGF